MRAHSLAAVTIAFAVVACTDATKPVAPGPFAPSFEIADGAHGGNQRLYFLPPMVANPGHGKNVTGLAPVVDICAWNGSACTTYLAHFTTDPSATINHRRPRPIHPGNSETVRENGDHYIVNWHTRAFDLKVGGIYRISISVGSEVLGYADVKVVGKAKALKNVDTDEFVGLLDDRTLPIKFRIESGAAASGTISGTVAGPYRNEVFNGYPVYLFAVDKHGNVTASPVANTTTDVNGAYTFTSTSKFTLVAGTYLVCEENPSLYPFEYQLSEGTPSGELDPPPPLCPGASVYAKYGYSVVAPATGDARVNDFFNGFGT